MTKPAAAINTVNVITLFGGVIQDIVSFPETDTGNKSAKGYFLALVKKEFPNSDKDEREWYWQEGTTDPEGETSKTELRIQHSI